MAASIATVKLSGFTSATSSVTPTGGTQLGSLLTVNVYDDGSMVFQDSGGNTRKINYSAELHALLQRLTVGAGGVSTTKTWHKD